MNPISTILFGLGMVLVTGSAQQSNCGCAPQPTVIQVSCGGAGRGNSWSQPQSQQPPMTHEPHNVDDIMNMCRFDQNGYPTGHPPGGFPQGFRVPQDEYGNPNPILPPGFSLPEPPPNWDGNLETLGFNIPQPGTPEYNMFMCLPIPVINV